MPNVCVTGSCSSAQRTSHAPLFLPPMFTVAAIGSCSLCDRFACDAPGQHAGAEEGALERAAPMDATTAEAGRFTDGVEPGNDRAVGLEHAARQIGLNPAQALAREDELANGDERHGLGVVDLLELADAQAIAAVVAKVGDAPQLLVVVVGGAAIDLPVVV